MSFVKGIPGVRSYLKSTDKKVEQILKNEMEVAVRSAEFDAKQNAPVDTGKHRQNIVGETERSRLRGKLSANMPYSAFLEFGTGASVEVPEGFEELAIQFKGKGKNTINLPARPHIIPAATKAANDFKRNVDKKLDNL